MSGQLNLFIDDGGVMNDNSLRRQQWPALVGEFFAPRLGGDFEVWREANQSAFEDAWERSKARLDLGFDAWARAYDIDWLRIMASRVGVAAPDDDDEALTLARQAVLYIITRVRSAFPGAAEAICRLSDLGCALYTASGSVSWELDVYLACIGVRERFTALYGPDLVQRFKYPFGDGTYYSAIFDHAGVSPSSAVVVDNALVNLALAAAAGARTVLVTSAEDRVPSPAGFEPDFRVPVLADLPALLEREGVLP